MKYLHGQEEMTPKLLREPEVKQFIDTHASILNQAVNEGIKEVPTADITIDRMKESNYIFSGFKTFHEMNEAWPLLVDESGNRKSFETFLNDVQKVNETYNRYYLKAEYNFAIQSSLSAARWKQFSQDGDRYNLQYQTIGDERVRISHQLLDGITLPITSSFWDSYFPPNGWGCRCNVIQVRKSKYPTSNENEAMNLGSQATAGRHREMFMFNPGKRQAVFGAYNPYTIKQCSTCNNNIKLTKTPNNELCKACRIIHSIKEQKEKQRARRKEIRKEASELKEKKLSNPHFDKEIHITGKGIKEWINQPHKYYLEKNEALLDVERILSDSKYLGCGTDVHDSSVTVHLFETEIKEESSWIIVREFNNGKVNLHSISDSPNILNILK